MPSSPSRWHKSSPREICSQRRDCGQPLVTAVTSLRTRAPRIPGRHFTRRATLPVYHPLSAAQVAIRADFDSYLASDTFSVQVRVRVGVRVWVWIWVRVWVRVSIMVRARLELGCVAHLRPPPLANFSAPLFLLQVTRVPTLQGPLNALVPPSYDAATLAALPVPTAHQQWWALMSG